MKTQRFDELNNYFTDMEIPKSEKNKRIKLADAIIEVFLYFFEAVQVDLKAHKPLDIDLYMPVILTRFTDALDIYSDNLIENYPDLKSYPETVVKEIISTTFAHVYPIEVKDDGTIIQEVDAVYFISPDRAMTIGKNEANTVGNAVNHADAVANGYVSKTWVTMRDELVRQDHMIADGQEVGINENFVVGNCEMPYPRYWLAPAEQTVNCRCTVEYH